MPCAGELNLNTLEVLKELLRKNSDISSVHLVPIVDSTFVQSAIESNAKDQAQIELALAIREEHKFSFWDSLCSVFIDRENYSKRLLKKVFHHNYNYEVNSVTSFDFLDGFLPGKKTQKYAISSKVIMSDGRVCHVPLIDFHCQVSAPNQRLVQDVLNTLDIGPGLLLDSGNSYHFIGMNLIEMDMFGCFIGKLIMFNPIIDKSWAAHQLIEGYCALRVTEKNGRVPEVVSEIY
jgi:hypothetical protein